MVDQQTLELEQGDFLYQVDQELFLVVMDEREDSYLFSVHGWRDIDKSRAYEYVEGEAGKLHSQAQFENVVEEAADDETKAAYKKLRSIFQSYSKDVGETEIADTFSMEDM